MTKNRTFSVHPQMIFSLIKAQAGTLAKAVLENIMNSIDAKATKVEIKITPSAIQIVDDGHGFRSLKEIEDCFEVFGFPHEEGERLYGQFGIGRAQLWSFASAVWKTNTFKMDVDIKNRGLDYKLVENQPQIQGLQIDSKFYQKQTTREIQDFTRELTELAMFAQVPIFLNGQKINKSPSDIKWDFETDDAWIKLTATTDLYVYNLGVAVRKYAAYQIGSGGLVVTKPGVRLALNMARNDILVSECKVWARIKPFIRRKSDDTKKERKTRLTRDEIANLAMRFMENDVEYGVIENQKIIKDVHGKAYTLYDFFRRNAYEYQHKLTVTGDASSLAQRAHSTKMAFVLSAESLSVFGYTQDEFKTWMSDLLDAAANHRSLSYTAKSLKDKLALFDTVQEAVPSLKEGYLLVPTNEHTPEEGCILQGLEYINSDVFRCANAQLEGPSKTGCRQLRVGISDTALAWTDARAYVAFSRDTLKLANQGLTGFITLVNILLHEYLHDESSAGSHVHDVDFYRHYHDASLTEEFTSRAFIAYRKYVQTMMKSGLRLNATQLREMTHQENLEYLEPDKKGKYFQAEPVAAQPTVEA